MIMMALLTGSGVILRRNPSQLVSFSASEVALLYRAVVKPLPVASASFAGARSTNLRRHAMEHEIMRQALERAAGNIRNAASDLGISRATMYRRLKSFRKAADA